MSNPGQSRVRTRWWIRLLALLAVITLVGAACGSDDDDEGGATGTDTKSEDAVTGGQATVLLFSEIGTMDPVSSTGSGGSDAQRFFPVYGALITYQGEKNEAVPYLAESLTAAGTDFATWTLKLRPGITFSDGSAYDAEAVKVNWERLKVPENRSPSRGIAASIASLTVKDPTTLEIKLVAPNAHFPNSVSRFGGMNYIASPTAIKNKHDLVNKPIGAGPF